MNGFKIKYDRNTIDHLGIKLYSSFPPVLAELISNAYDADAENVIIEIDYDNKTVLVSDDGEGMSHDEINDQYLVIGRNRRTEDKGLSHKKQRKVTGKKGLGKLATFGVANEIKVCSVKEGLKNSFILNYDDLKRSSGDEYSPTALEENIPTKDKSGTKIEISKIRQKNIMSLENLAISISKRFSFNSTGFNITLNDVNSSKSMKITRLTYLNSIEREFEWHFPKDFTSQIQSHEELSRLEKLGVTGYVYTKSTPMKNKDKGFLIYVRNKLASENMFFDERSNDNFYSYVSGCFNVDYIDDDIYNDLISTARQSILWEEMDNTVLLKNDLKKLVSLIELDWREKRKIRKEERLKLEDSFFEGLGAVEKNEIIKIKNILLKDESSEPESIRRILDNVKTSFKFESFKEYISKLDKNDELTLDNIQKVASDWEFIESKELAKVAVGRIHAIEQFEKFINNNESESKVIQPFLEKFPWILDPRITTFQRELQFRKILKDNFPDEELNEPNRRIDFLCNCVNGQLMIIELKRPNIKLSFKEVTQVLSYQKFIKEHYQNAVENIVSYLISDRYDMDYEVKAVAEGLQKSGTLFIKSYSDLLAEAKKFNEEFINKYHEVNKAHE